MSEKELPPSTGFSPSTIEQELQAAIDGGPMTADLREWCLERVTALAEFSDFADPANSSDQELAKAVRKATYACVRSAISESETLTDLRNGFLSRRIAEAYQEAREKPELVEFKRAMSWSRQYGFPIVCTLEGRSEAEQLNWAAKVLVRVSGCWQVDDLKQPMPDLLTPPEGTDLHDDATSLIQRGLSSMREVKIHMG